MQTSVTFCNFVELYLHSFLTYHPQTWQVYQFKCVLSRGMHGFIPTGSCYWKVLKNRGASIIAGRLSYFPLCNLRWTITLKLSQILVRSGRATRQSRGQHYFRNILALKRCYRASFFPRAVSEWNHLPPHIRNASFVDCFKSSLIRDQDLISKSHYYDSITADHFLCTYIPCGRFAQY